MEYLSMELTETEELLLDEAVRNGIADSRAGVLLVALDRYLQYQTEQGMFQPK